MAGVQILGLGGPENIQEGSEYVLTSPLKCHILSFKNRLLLYNSKFHSINDEQLDTITSLILVMLTMLLSLCLISSKQTVSSNQCLCCYTGLKVIYFISFYYFFLLFLLFFLIFLNFFFHFSCVLCSIVFVLRVR